MSFLACLTWSALAVGPDAVAAQFEKDKMECLPDAYVDGEIRKKLPTEPLAFDELLGYGQCLDARGYDSKWFKNQDGQFAGARISKDGIELEVWNFPNLPEKQAISSRVRSGNAESSARGAGN